MKSVTGIPLKQWFGEQAERENIRQHAVEQRYYRGKYPGLQLRRVNARVIQVAYDPYQTKAVLSMPG